jgi:hypothetical protein
MTQRRRRFSDHVLGGTSAVTPKPMVAQATMPLDLSESSTHAGRFVPREPMMAW